MAKQQNAANENIGEALNKTELFFENHGRKLIYTLIAIVLIGGAFYGYNHWISQPKAENASALLAEAQLRFEAANPDYELALLGDENGAGFLNVAEQYGSTPSGNLAKHYAGICYMHLQDWENAAKMLAKYSPVKGIPGALINAQNYGLQGDVAVEQGNYAAAIKFYDKAVKAADNNLTAPMYLRKAGLAAQANGNTAQAKAYFERILADYPASMDARDAEKLIGSLR